MKKKIIKPKKYAGLTLIEMLVAVSVFVLTLTALIQIYISSLRSERLAYDLLNAENSVRYAIELISRDVRMGQGFNSGPNSLSFTTYYEGESGQEVTYKLENAQLKRKSGTEGDYISITPNSITLAPLGDYPFIVNNTNQFFVTIRLQATIEERNKSYTFPVETSVTPRYFNLQP